MQKMGATIVAVTAATLRRLAALELSPEQMGGVLTLLAEMQEAEETRLEKQRTRKRKSRDSHVTVTGQERDEDGRQVSPKEIPPTPPKEITPSTSLRSVSFSARATDAAFANEFATAFWPPYPHKVGKPAALKAFRAVRKRGVELERIVSGIDRYIREKPRDRPWLNPATFLNQDRFDDQPASPPTPAKPRPHDAIFRALAAAALEGGGGDERQACPDERHSSDAAAGPSDTGAFGDAQEPPRLRSAG
jgi:hypothetical protein